MICFFRNEFDFKQLFYDYVDIQYKIMTVNYGKNLYLLALFVTYDQLIKNDIFSKEVRQILFSFDLFCISISYFLYLIGGCILIFKRDDFLTDLGYFFCSFFGLSMLLNFDFPVELSIWYKYLAAFTIYWNMIIAIYGLSKKNWNFLFQFFNKTHLPP